MPRDDIAFATFNLLNLTGRGRGAYGEPPLSDADHDRRIAWIGGMLGRLRADVVGVQELWDPAPLEEAVRAAGLEVSHRVLFPPDAEPNATIWCGAVVRRDLVDDASVRWVRDFPEGFRLRTEGWRKVRDAAGQEACPPADAEPKEPAFEVTLGAYSRPVLRFTARVGAGRADIEVLVCHLKSKNPTPIDCDAWYREDPGRYRSHKEALGSALSTVRRTAEAAALRVELDGITKGNRTPVVLLGDVNDGQDTPTLEILTGDPGFGSAARKPVDDGAALYSVQAIQEARSLRDVFYTYIHNGVHSSLDNILVSQEFYDFSRLRTWVMQELHIHNDHLNKTWGGRTVIESDHGVVRARFLWSPAPGAAPAPDDPDPVPLDGAGVGP